MIELNEKSRAFWFAALPVPADFMAHLAEEDDHYVLTWRFRYYRDDKVGEESTDVKRWYQIKIEPKHLEVIPQAMELTGLLHGLLGTLEGVELYHCIRKKEEELEDFIARWNEMPFVHVEIRTRH